MSTETDNTELQKLQKEMRDYALNAVNKAGADVINDTYFNLWEWNSPGKLTEDDISIRDPEFHEGNARFTNALIAGGLGSDFGTQRSIHDVCEDMDSILSYMDQEKHGELRKAFQDLNQSIKGHYGWTIYDAHFDKDNASAHGYYTAKKSDIMKKFALILQTDEFEEFWQDYQELLNTPRNFDLVRLDDKDIADHLELVAQALYINEVVIPAATMIERQTAIRDFLAENAEIPQTLKDDIQTAAMNDPLMLFALSSLPQEKLGDFEKATGLSAQKAALSIKSQMTEDSDVQLQHLQRYSLILSQAETINALIENGAFKGKELERLKKIDLEASDKGGSYLGRINNLYENPSYLKAYADVFLEAVKGDELAQSVFENFNSYDPLMDQILQGNARLNKELGPKVFKLSSERQTEILHFYAMYDAVKDADALNPSLGIPDVETQAVSISGSGNNLGSWIHSDADDFRLAYASIQNSARKLLTIEPASEGHFQFADDVSFHHNRSDILELVKDMNGQEAAEELRQIMLKSELTNDDLTRGMGLITKAYETALQPGNIETFKNPYKLNAEYQKLKALESPLKLYAKQAEGVKKEIDQGLDNIFNTPEAEKPTADDKRAALTMGKDDITGQGQQELVAANTPSAAPKS